MLVEIVNMSDRVMHKAVQLYVKERPILVLGVGKASHARILEDYLEKISHDYAVAGMGIISLMNKRKLYSEFISIKECPIDANHARLVYEQLEAMGWKLRKE